MSSSQIFINFEIFFQINIIDLKIDFNFNNYDNNFKT